VFAMIVCSPGPAFVPGLGEIGDLSGCITSSWFSHGNTLKILYRLQVLK